MFELINQLGIDWRLLLAQVVNFLILFWVLKRFAFAPLKKFLSERQHRIEKGLKDAQEALLERKKLEVLRTEIITAAQKEAENMLQEIRLKGSREYEKILASAGKKSEEVLAQAKFDIEQEKEKAIFEVKTKIGALIIMATENVLREKIDENRDREIVARALREIKPE